MTGNGLTTLSRWLPTSRIFWECPQQRLRSTPVTGETHMMILLRLSEKFRNGMAMYLAWSRKILLENRTDQFITSGSDIARFRDFVIKDDPWLLENFGIVLDIQQLSTKTKQNFLSSFHQIPDDCLKGFHIHRSAPPPVIRRRHPVGGCVQENCRDTPRHYHQSRNPSQQPGFRGYWFL